MNLKLKTGIVLLAALNLIQPAPASAEIAAAHVYHNHMPNFWPFYAVDIGANYKSTPVGGPIRYIYDGEVIELKRNPPPGYSYYLPGGEIMPHDDLVAYYSHHAKTGAYFDWPWQVAGDMNSNANTGQVHVTMSGALVNNVQSLVRLKNVAGYDRPNWGEPWRNAYNTLKTPHAYRTLDLIHFTGHHSMGPLVGAEYFLKDLLYQNAVLAQDYFLNGSFKSSNGFFPTELGFSERLIPTLAKLGVKWSVLGNNHFSRTLQDYPFDTYYPNKDTMVSPPNRADLQNVSQVGAWVTQPMAHEQQQIANKYPFASTPHWVRYVDPATGREDRLVGIPVDQAGSWLEGWEGRVQVSDSGLQNFEGLVPQQQFFVIAHDGDNPSGRAGSLETWLNGRAVTCTEGAKCIGIDEYLSTSTPPAGDSVHVQDGSWVDTRDSSSDPQWHHWRLPFGIWRGQFAEFNRVTGLDLKPKPNLDGLTEGMTVSFEHGFHYLERNFALLQAALNYARTAEQIWLDSHPGHWQPTTAMDREITYPGNQLNPWMLAFPVKGDPDKDYKGGANPAELAWYFLLPAMDSGFGYYDENKDDHVKGTLAFNNSLYFAKPYVQANLAGDRTGPSVWWPQRWPYNPGSVNADKSEGWTVHHFDHHFAIYTYAYDVSGISTLKVRIRPHKDKVITAADNTFRVYDPVALKAAGVPNIDPAKVGDWKDYPLTRRDLKPVMNGVAWSKANMDTMAVLPAQEIGDLYYAYLGDYRDQIVDYYLEATDSKGNVTRSEIQQVYVGAGRYNKVGGRYIETTDGGIVGTYPFLDAVSPTVPGKPALARRTACGLTLDWAASTDNVGVAGYELYRNDTSVGTTAATSYTDSGFKPQTTYAYAVLAYDSAGNKSGLSEALQVTDAPVDTTPPGAPGQPVASNVTASTAVLSWPAANDDCGVAQYEVQRDGVRTETTTTTTYTDSTLVPATQYVYQIIALDTAGNPSTPSPVIKLETPPANTATVYYFRKDWSKACIHYTPTGGSWTTPPGVEMKQACPNWWVRKDIVLGPATAMTATFNNCTGVWDNNGGRNYSLKTNVSAVKDAQVTAGVNPCQGGDDITPPSVPTGLKASEITGTTLKLCWNASTDDKSGVKDYLVWRDGSQRPVVTETCFTDRGLTPDTSYRYTVIARDKADNSSVESEPLSVHTEREEGNKVTVYYRPGFPTTCFRYRPESGNWIPSPGRPMEKSTDFPGYNQITVDIGGATRLEAAFNNCKDQWDSNDGQNYRFDQGAWTYDAACSPRIATGVPRPASAVGVTFNVNATTVWGQNVYVVGDMAELGGWDAARAKSLSVTTYPIWSVTLTLPANKSFQYKYIKKDESSKVLWESGDNRTATTSSSCSQILNDTWR